MGELYTKAEAFARKHHGDKVGKNGRLFIEHPLAVAARFDDEITKVAAVLHDIVEKTDVTLDEIQTIFGEEVASLVDNLTVRMGESKEEALLRSLLDTRSAAIRISDALNNADVRRWQENMENLDPVFVGSFIDKIELILRQMSIFGTMVIHMRNEDVSAGKEEDHTHTNIKLNNTAVLLGPELNSKRLTALENIARAQKPPPDVVVN